jgi:MFS family permease
MLSLIIPFAIGWSLIVWAQNFTMMLIGRFVLGIAGGAFCIASPQYTSEIAEKEIRGTLGTFFQLFVILGILFAYVVGAFTNIFSLSVICGVLPLIFGIMFVFMPETPYYLIYKNKMESCEKSLWWLRGRHYDIQTEINEIKTEFERQQNERTSLREAFKKRATIKALIIAVGSLIFQQLSGINVVIFYAGDIFKVTY